MIFKLNLGSCGIILPIENADNAVSDCWGFYSEEDQYEVNIQFCCIEPYYIILYNIILYCIIFSYDISCYIIQYFTILYHTISYYHIILFYIIPYDMILFRIVLCGDEFHIKYFFVFKYIRLFSFLLS